MQNAEKVGEYEFDNKSIMRRMFYVLKFTYTEKTTKCCEIFTLLLTGTTQDKSKVKISQHFVVFSEYMNCT